MKTLVIHPKDVSTDFLKPIYADIKSKTVIVKDVTAGRLREAIHTHDVIIMLGHGCANGLFNVAAVGKGPYTVGHELVEELRGKQLIAIWCNSDKFIERHNLNALYSGMFISEVSEARYCSVNGDQVQVNESNDKFAALLGHMLTETSMDLGKTYDMVLESYTELGKTNVVAKYNSDRLYCNLALPCAYL